MGQSQSSKVHHHLEELHRFDPSVTHMKDELLNLVRDHYRHCDKESEETGRDMRVPLPSCRTCAQALTIFHEHVVHFHKKLKAYTQAHPPVWPDGEEEQHKKNSEQLTLHAEVLMGEMKGIIEAEIEHDKRPLAKDKHHALPPPSPLADSRGPYPAYSGKPFDLDASHFTSHSAATSSRGPPPSSSGPIQSALLQSPTQSHSAVSTSAAPHHSSGRGNSLAQSAGTEKAFQQAARYSQLASADVQHPSSHSRAQSKTSQVPVGRASVQDPPNRTQRDNPISPGGKDVFDPDALPSIAHHDDMTPKAEVADPFAGAFDTLEAKLPEELKQHPKFPYPRESPLSTVVNNTEEEQVQVSISTYTVESVDPDDGPRTQTSKSSRHKPQPTMENAIPHAQGVNPHDLATRLAHLPANSNEKGNVANHHRAEPSLVNPPPNIAHGFDADKLNDKLAKVDLNVHRHRPQESMASLTSIDEKGMIPGEELEFASNKAVYSGSSRALEPTEDDTACNGDFETLSKLPSWSRNGRVDPDRAAHEINSGLDHFFDNTPSTNASRFETLEDSVRQPAARHAVDFKDTVAVNTKGAARLGQHVIAPASDLYHHNAHDKARQIADGRFIEEL